MPYIRDDSLLGMARELYESGSASDFPLLLGNSMNKKFIDKFRGMKSAWPFYTLQDEVPDFKTYDRLVLGEMEDLKKVPDGGGYKDSKVREDRYQVSVETFGRDFSLTRKTIINDDLRAFQDWSAKAAKAAFRTRAKLVVHNIIYDNAVAYDGVALFHGSSHSGFNNLGSTSLAGTITVADVIQGNLEAFRQAKDEDGEVIGINFDQYPAMLVHPTALSGQAKAVCAEQVTDTTNKMLVDNPIYGAIKPVEEPFLDEKSTTQWYIFVDPRVLNAVEFDTLEGGKEPALLYQVSQFQRAGGGGNDPYAWFDIDEIRWRIRDDYGAKGAFYQAAYKHAA